MSSKENQAEIVTKADIEKLTKERALSEEKIDELEQIALKTRKWIIKMTHAAGSGHPGGSLSATDTITVLYFNVMNHDPKNPRWSDRDRFVLSKGHAAPALYATLAQAGYFPEEELITLRKFKTRLQGHPSMRALPGIDMSTGSLGQGLSVANGMAIAALLKGNDRLDDPKYRVYSLIGDGESQEGQIWEAAMAAAHYELDNLTAVTDRNWYQIDGETEEVMGLGTLADKWRSFGWQVYEIDGHDMAQIITAYEEAKKIMVRPQMIIANSTKCKGVSCLEKDKLKFHGNAPSDEEMAEALEELGGEP
jgi:transketolase